MRIDHCANPDKGSELCRLARGDKPAERVRDRTSHGFAHERERELRASHIMLLVSRQMSVGSTPQLRYCVRNNPGIRISRSSGDAASDSCSYISTQETMLCFPFNARESGRTKEHPQNVSTAAAVGPFQTGMRGSMNVP